MFIRVGGREKNTPRHSVPAGDKALLEKMTEKDKSYQKAALTDRDPMFAVLCGD